MSLLSGHILFAPVPEIIVGCLPEPIEMELESPSVSASVDQPSIEVTIPEPTTCQH